MTVLSKYTTLAALQTKIRGCTGSHQLTRLPPVAYLPRNVEI